MIHWSGILATLAFCYAAVSASAQNRITIRDFCMHDNPPSESVAFGDGYAQEEQDKTSEEIVEEVLNLAATVRKIDVVADDGRGNACSTITRDQKLIIFVDDSWLRRITDNNYWLRFFTLAHEVGHHANSHYIGFDSRNPYQNEFDADFFAGRMLRLAGGDISVIEEFFRICPFDTTPNSPDCQFRMTAARSGFESSGASKAGPLNIVLMDGDQVSYERDACSTNECKENARSNRVVLRSELNDEFGSDKLELIEYGIFPGWNSPAEVEAKDPSLVILHWSGFEGAGKNSSETLSCDPIENNRCSELIIENLSKINTRSKNDPRFIIYSRNRWLCGDEFRSGLISRIPEGNPQLASKIGLISINDAYERGGVLSNKFSVADIRDMASFFLGIPSTFKSDPAQGICILSKQLD